MNGKEKVVSTNKSLTQRVSAVIVSALALVGTIVNSAENDLTVVVSEALSLEQIVESELQSARFAKQIAEYNGFDAITTIIPIGTTIQIPKPYLRHRDFGQVIFAKGDVVHSQESMIVNPPAKGAYIYKGDKFATGEDGFISLKFSSGSVVNIQPESRVTVEDIACVDETVSCVIELNAELGEVVSNVTPRPDSLPPVKFKVTTPFLSAAVRGTSFYVNVDKSVGRVGVTDGLVATEVAEGTNDLPKGKGLLAEANMEPELVDLLDAPELMMSEGTPIYSAEDTIRWKPLPAARQYKLAIAEDDSFTAPLFSKQISQSSAPVTWDLSPGEYHLRVAGVDSKDFRGLPASTQFSFAEIVGQDRIEFQITRPSGVVVDIAPLDYTGSVEIIITNGFDDPTEVRRLVGSISEGLKLDLDPAQDWVIKARKVFSPTSVSAYSNQYLLEANK